MSTSEQPDGNKVDFIIGNNGTGRGRISRILNQYRICLGGHVPDINLSGYPGLEKNPGFSYFFFFLFLGFSFFYDFFWDFLFQFFSVCNQYK